MGKVKVEIIKKLVRSKNKEDIKLGVSFIFNKFNGDPARIEAFLDRHGLNKYVDDDYPELDMYMEDLNFHTSCGNLTVHEAKFGEITPMGEVVHL